MAKIIFILLVLYLGSPLVSLLKADDDQIYQDFYNRLKAEEEYIGFFATEKSCISQLSDEYLAARRKCFTGISQSREEPLEFVEPFIDFCKAKNLLKEDCEEEWEKVLTIVSFELYANMPIFDYSTDKVIEHRSIVYAEYSNKKLALDLFMPKEPMDQPVPAVVCIHGGGWMVNRRIWFEPFAKYLAAHGMAAVTIDYRMRPAVRVIDCVYDTKAAVRWVRANAEKYGIDPNRIGAIGASAGAHLAALLATTADRPELEGNGGNANVSSAIQAAVGIATPAFTPSTSMERAERFGFTEEEVRVLSPYQNVSDKAAPLFLIHGTADQTVPPQNSQDLFDRYNQFGVHVELKWIPGEDHGFYEGNDRAIKLAAEFFKRQFTHQNGPDSVAAIHDPAAMGQTYKISKTQLKDKIKGAWAAQVIGVTFGGPTEFRHQSTFIPDYQPIAWGDGLMKWWYKNEPGLYDDIYMDLTFVDVFEKEGLDAPVGSFATAYANAGYFLWHANQMARYNILNGIMPPESGHWLNNPHADDIDFEIEADFAGIMAPGMPNSSSEICDKIGHIMNYGDGWYGGVYVAAMYTLAFVSDDINYIVEEALKVVPKESNYYKTIKDVINWYKENPDDWHQTWFRVQQKWGQDVGCPDGVFTTVNIDAKINSAWIVLGLLYGQGDLGKTYSISTRAGDDSDCNPGNAGGIVGTMIGYKNIPEYWRQGLTEVEPIDFKYTTISLNDVYAMSFRHALEVIKRNGGQVNGDEITIKLQKPKPVKLEVGFKGHYPVERRILRSGNGGEKEWGVDIMDDNEFEFEGVGFVFTGKTVAKGEQDYTFNVEMYIDDKLVETTSLPTNYHDRKPAPFWRYQLSRKKHRVRFKVLNPTDKASSRLHEMIIYDSKPLDIKY